MIYLRNMDRLDFLRELKTQGLSAQLIVTSPPYNTGKEYESRLSMQEYVLNQYQTISACYDVLTDNGSICWQVGHTIIGQGRKKEVVPLDMLLYPEFLRLGLKLRNRIVWTFGHGLHDSYRFSGRHETILWFTKSDDYVFNLDPVRVPQKYPGKKYFKGQKAGQLSCNPLGKNPGDVWDIPNVKNNHVEKTAHPCQFPVGLVQRLILALTNPGDVVLDPYIGSGSTGIAAMMTGRSIAGCDTNREYMDIAIERIAEAKAGRAVVRDMNRPVYGVS